MSLLDQYVAYGFLSPADAQSLRRYGTDKQEEAVQAAVVAAFQKFDPLAAARRAVEPEFSSEKFGEISYFYQQMAAADAEQDGAGGDRLADTSKIAAAFGVGRRRAQQILRTTLSGLQDEHQLQLFGGVR
ncbi:hypothetical protein [Acidithiobacillus ferriphilus]|uniref:hypothetical protein n=1 Tax=Acidithiobacillus ferriphilus TaxID=1689834 RepID=UPI001C0747CF|nr:hypothetical protein [Acidithiobacillus ferriphilus]MBU2830191.1 hypothetical protein [Acidithiobacillus ferriphilus]